MSALTGSFGTVYTMNVSVSVWYDKCMNLSFIHGSIDCAHITSCSLINCSVVNLSIDHEN